MQIKKIIQARNAMPFSLSLYLFILILLMQVNNVWAHASLVKSEPPRRASLSESPKQVQLWFNEEIEASYATIEVLDSDGNVVSTEEPKPVENDLKSVVLALPLKLDPGRYKIEYRILSVDGHVVESSYGFRIKNNLQ